jgi:hypothetical protein
MPGCKKMRIRRNGLAKGAFPKIPKLQRFRVMFIQPDGKLLDIWYTFEHRGEAEMFAKRVHETDRDLRPEIIAVEDPGLEVEPVHSETVKRLGVWCWAGYNRLSISSVEDQGWGGFCGWWKPGSGVRAEALT